ncbi:MAG: hypothetical protein AAFO07_32515 [Bacteroidota bacterium]
MKKSFILLLLLIPLQTFGQAQDQTVTFDQGDFLIIGGGVTRYELRDAGVSPLFYQGWLPSTGFSFPSYNGKWSSTLYGTFGYGNLTRTELATYSSTTYAIGHGGDLLRNIKALKPNLNLLVGGAYHGTTNIRNTPAFRNAGNTVETFNTLMASGRLELLMDKTKDRRKLLWLIPLKPGRRVSKLTYQLNIPIVNLSWAPSFTYLDDFSDGTTDYDQKNEFSVGGFRINSQLNYQYFFRNGNGLQLSYFWDAFSGKEGLGQIELAQHQVHLGLIIRFSELNSVNN